jgi:hypothetical protein
MNSVSRMSDQPHLNGETKMINILFVGQKPETVDFSLARVRSCHPNELRSPEFIHPVERFDRGRNFGGATGVMAPMTRL